MKLKSPTYLLIYESARKHTRQSFSTDSGTIFSQRTDSARVRSGIFVVAGLSAQELNTLGNFILLIGQVMVTNAAQINFINSSTYGNISQTDIEAVTQLVLDEIRRKGNL